MNKIIITTLSVLLVAVVMISGYFLARPYNTFSRLSVGEMHTEIISQMDTAIAKAMAEGDYRCCIHPACTMCFLSGNKWNYGKAGTCACDDFIAKGEDPCPQCKSGLIEDTGVSCEIKSEECDSLR